MTPTVRIFVAGVQGAGLHTHANLATQLVNKTLCFSKIFLLWIGSMLCELFLEKGVPDLTMDEAQFRTDMFG